MERTRINYKSSVKPLTPFTLTELFNQKATDALKDLPKDQLWSQMQM